MCGAPALVDVDLQLRPALDQRAAGAGVVEVDVGQQQRAWPPVAERLEQGRQARGRARIDQHVIDLPAADHALATEVHEVDQAHAPSLAIAGLLVLGGRDRGGRSPAVTSVPGSSGSAPATGAPTLSATGPPRLLDRRGARSRFGRGRRVLLQLALASAARRRARAPAASSARRGKRSAAPTRRAPSSSWARLARVVDDPVALGPDPVGVGVEVLHLAARRRRAI